MKIKTMAGDELDAIVAEHYGADDARGMSATLQANPGLARVALSLPAGIIIDLPDLTPVQQGLNLWD